MKSSETRIDELLLQVGINATAATELLQVAATYLERGEALPTRLAHFLAASFNQAALEPCSERGNALARALGLSAPGKEGRPRVAVAYNDIRRFVAEAIVNDPNISETKLKAKVAKCFNISPTKALSFVKSAAFIPKLLRGNKLRSLVRSRSAE